ncbi:MAG: 50S ribosomal protein L25 [Anaerolinea sp.]|nr:50S ribosomal protein L25 [Anaerolinea sp.]
MAERAVIQAAPRTVLGKKVKLLRQKGILPANVYGPAVPSQAVEVDAREFARNIKATGLRSMFELNVAGEPAPRYVIIRGLSRQGGTGDISHVDFFQVDPTRPITANVPLRLVGESPAVRDLAGVLLPALDLVSVRCLPLDIPSTIEVDVAMLKSFDTSMTVGDIKAPEGVEILTDPAVTVATVSPPRLRLAVAEDADAGAPADAD